MADDKLTDDYGASRRLYILDPLSTIIKLAILSNKTVGSKIFIRNNYIVFQDFGPFQSVCRIFYNTSKADLQYLFNPIEIACKEYLSELSINRDRGMIQLFESAQKGLSMLIDTYSENLLTCICLKYYYSLITTHLTKQSSIFMADKMSMYYTENLQSLFKTRWTEDNIRIVLGLTQFLFGDNNVRKGMGSLESLMTEMDLESHRLITAS